MCKAGVVSGRLSIWTIVMVGWEILREGSVINHRNREKPLFLLFCKLLNCFEGIFCFAFPWDLYTPNVSGRLDNDIPINWIPGPHILLQSYFFLSIHAIILQYTWQITLCRWSGISLCNSVSFCSNSILYISLALAWLSICSPILYRYVIVYANRVVSDTR